MQNGGCGNSMSIEHFNYFESLLAIMQNPDFYPHPIQGKIGVMQTHCSVVFLTGDYAYKLKKTVNFGFLDYSTLEKRHHFLLQELTMNQPIAPEIYQAVLPISQVGNNFVLGSEENIVEYVLRMAEFPQSSLLVNLFTEGELKPEYLRELGLKVADFHQKAKISDYIDNFGQIAIIKQSVDENYQMTEKYIGSIQTLERYQQTRQFTDDFLAQRVALFEQRRLSHKIRECHGDLHLSNICYWHHQIQLFDRIEFNEPFRLVDVMYDVAFTIMDLDAKGRSDLGNIFLNTYLEQTGDWEGVQVLPFYLCRQAYVRAKVTSMLSDDPHISETEKATAIALAKDYYQLAWHYTQIPVGKIILMSGLSGSGKSTVANHLAPQLNAIQIRSDAVRKHLAGISLQTKGDASLYSAAMNERTYGRLAELGLLLASQGFTVILDAKYDRSCWRSTIIQAAQAQNISLKIIHCQANLSTLRDRLLHRSGDISDATVDLLEQQWQQAETFTDQEKPYVITLDTEMQNIS
jgi:aminoglycoside phosphotransferase family enzyme/predicted kinase